jgi:uncharacterized OsmC-like protein
MSLNTTKVSLHRTEKPMRFEASGSNGWKLQFDADPSIGGTDRGARPMEALLMSLAACSAIDVVMILEKMRQEIEDFDIKIEAEREAVGDAKVYKKIIMTFVLTGQIEVKKLKRAIALSVEKYCSVSRMIEAVAEIQWRYNLNGKISEIQNEERQT